jgi:hypothetical protein
MRVTITIETSDDDSITTWGQVQEAISRSWDRALFDPAETVRSDYISIRDDNNRVVGGIRAWND